MANIREATHDDVPAMGPMAREFYEYSELETLALGYDHEQARNVLHGLILMEDGFVLIAEVDGKPAGIIGVKIEPWFLKPSQSIAVEVFLWVNRVNRRAKLWSRLIMEARKKAKEMGATHMSLGTIPKREKAIMRLYRPFGCRKLESCLIMEV